MGNYVRFTENNDWEGEIWHFWIPLDGNEEIIADLRRLVDGETYSISDDTLPEESVDVLVAANAWEGNCSYLPANTKLAGKLFLSDHLRYSTVQIDPDDFEGPFYKGGIRECMKED